MLYNDSSWRLSLQMPVQFVTICCTLSRKLWSWLSLCFKRRRRRRRRLSCLPQLATHSRSWTKSLHHVGVYRLTAQLLWMTWPERYRKREGEEERERERGNDGQSWIPRQKSIHQWQICWWYESIIRRVKDRLSLIISLKIAQMTSARHEHELEHEIPVENWELWMWMWMWYKAEVERRCGCLVGTAVSPTVWPSVRESVRQAAVEDRFGDLA